MSDSRPRNTWWRYVPKSREAGVLGVCFCSVALLCGVGLLFTTFHSPVAHALQILAVVLFAWSLLRSITGLAAIRRDTTRGVPIDQHR